jgi:hypothetical protein
MFGSDIIKRSGHLNTTSSQAINNRGPKILLLSDSVDFKGLETEDRHAKNLVP